MSIIKIPNIESWTDSIPSETQTTAINALETGSLVFLPDLSFDLTDHEKQFLTPKISDGKSKNVSYELITDNLWGTSCQGNARVELHELMKRFSKLSMHLVNSLFPTYKTGLSVAATSFRPVEVKGRTSSYRKDDTRLHVDAFPSRPTKDNRILRVFSNVNPNGADRIWQLGEPFEDVAKRFLPNIKRPIWMSHELMDLMGITKQKRSLYDHYMLNIHNKMKADEHYQATVPKTKISLPPNSTWLVLTDQASHAALKGQYIFEQTVYFPVSVMRNENYAPLRVLERLVGRPLV